MARPLTDRQQCILRRLIVSHHARCVNLATWELAAVLGWTEQVTATVLRQLRKRDMVEHAPMLPDDAHYINRHKITMTGLQALVARLGLYGERPETYASIGRRFGFTHQRASGVFKDALRMLANAACSE